MKYQPGDRVKFLNEVGGGIVKTIINEKLVNVETDDGFEMPVMPQELILEAPAAQDYQSKFSGNQEAGIQDREDTLFEEMFSKKPELMIDGSNEPQIYLAVVPLFGKYKSIETFRLYVINDSNYKVLYNISQKENEGLYTYRMAGMLDANTKIFFTEIQHEDLRDSRSYNIQAIVYQPDTYVIYSPFEKEVELDPFEADNQAMYSENDFFETRAHLHTICGDSNMEKEMAEISDRELTSVMSTKEIKEEKTGFEKGRRKEIEEVDLHIEELVDDHSHMTNREIVRIQMETFKTRLEEAIRNQVRKMVFIHGIGNGRLRFEIRNHLDLNYPQFRYQDASFKEYGFGATMVLLSKK